MSNSILNSALLLHLNLNFLNCLNLPNGTNLDLMDQMLHHIILQITPASAVMIRGTEPKDIEVLFLNIKLPWQQLADENILRFNVVFDEF